MRISKIGAKATYHKSLGLIISGYIQYFPPSQLIAGGLVYLFDFQSGTKPINEPND